MNRYLFIVISLSFGASSYSYCAGEKGDAWRKRVFSHVYDTQFWYDGESVSGPGSSMDSTHVIRQVLPAIVRAINARVFLDAACGDFNWMKELDLGVERYIGSDIVADLIAENQRKYGDRIREFRCLDIVKDALPRSDVVLCRDCLAHLSYEDIVAAIGNIKASGATYLLASTFPRMIENNLDIRTGDFRPVNLQAAPFNFPVPIMYFEEVSAEDNMVYWKKTLCLWRLTDIVVPGEHEFAEHMKGVKVGS